MVEVKVNALGLGGEQLAFHRGSSTTQRRSGISDADSFVLAADVRLSSWFIGIDTNVNTEAFFSRRRKFFCKQHIAIPMYPTYHA